MVGVLVFIVCLKKRKVRVKLRIEISVYLKGVCFKVEIIFNIV